jgi:hypothetical protein
MPGHVGQLVHRLLGLPCGSPRPGAVRQCALRYRTTHCATARTSTTNTHARPPTRTLDHHTRARPPTRTLETRVGKDAAEDARELLRCQRVQTGRVRIRLWVLLLVASLVAFSFTSAAGQPASQQSAGRPALPTQFGLGVSSANPAWMIQSGIPWTYRYQYLTGGVNTGSGWANWNPNGSFVTNYLKDSERTKAIPVFTYYQLLVSKPSSGSTEAGKLLSNLANPQTMFAYYSDYALLLRKLADTTQTVIVHLEPDLNGFAQQRVVQSDNRAASLPASVSNSGYAGLEDLPNHYQGFQQALIRLRDRIAPRVILATHVSAWSTGDDIGTNTNRELNVDDVAQKTTSFLESAGLADLVFVDPADRDAAFQELVNRDGGARWWDSTNKRFPNFERYNQYLAGIAKQTKRPLILWQIPVGNTVMRSQNNSWNHHQDNRVEYWLGGYPADGRLRALAESGVVALLFGRGADGNTSFEDEARDGITNPAPIASNAMTATVADDDGGFLRQVSARYYQQPLRSSAEPAPLPTVPLPTAPLPTAPLPTALVPTSAPTTRPAKPKPNVRKKSTRRRSTKPKKAASRTTTKATR